MVHILKKSVVAIMKVWFGTIIITYIAIFASFFYKYNKINDELDILFNECVSVASIYNCIPKDNQLDASDSKSSSYNLLMEEFKKTFNDMKANNNPNEFTKFTIECKKNKTMDNYKLTTCPNMGNKITVSISVSWAFKVPFLNSNSMSIFGGLRTLTNDHTIARTQEVICTAYYPE